MENGDDGRRLRFQWPDVLRKIVHTSPQSYPDREEVRQDLTLLVETTISELIDRIEPHPDNQAARDMRNHDVSVHVERLLELSSIRDRVQSLSRDYGRVRSRLDKLQDERKQLDWATSRDHLKFLAYRIFTGFGMMGLVLLTGWLAQYYGIPLPFLRLAA